MTFGNPDPHLMKDPEGEKKIKWIPISRRKYWSIKLLDFARGGSSCQDSGTEESQSEAGSGIGRES